ncbi:peptidase M3 [Brachybacterium endophyticum]|uniref:Peptidase M3 n=1 Tax=Brachybacterium endophyticum TaxID=2182385 RepID=A0A2U2RKN2_9MICO|nr:M3 family metallopeptidase [Brachybacterium endophyticum]PWH06391.1 peptidase M3 [Brachybacterium endophyticum]
MPRTHDDVVPAADPEPAADGPDLTGNPFADPSELPYGLPDFAAIRTEHFLPALRAGIAEQRSLIEQVATDEDMPTFATVLRPLAEGSPILQRTLPVLFHLLAADATEELQEVEDEIAPELAALEDSVWLDPRLFTRVRALVRDADSLALSDEERYVLERTYLRFELHGAQLDPAQKARLGEVNQELSTLQTRFTQQTKADLHGAALHLTDEAELAGLDASQRESARLAAREAGLDGWLLTLILPTMQPLLASLTDRDVRERLYTASRERGEETWGLAKKIARLRAEKAHLLDFEDFAELAVADRTAGTPAAVESFLAQIAAPAVRNADREAERVAERAARDGLDELAPWDWSYYSELIRTEEYAVDQSELQPYFVLETVLEDGVFRAAHEVYGLSFTEREDLTPPHPLARIWEVTGEDGEKVGLFIGDYFTRPSKRGGAWMNTLVDQSRHDGTLPIVMNTLNVSRPAEGRPAFVTLDEVDTMFHEFGHALHALLSDVENASVAGTVVARDVVEFPSQVNEMWALRPGIVEHYARHVETGEVVPDELLERVRAAAQWNAGFRTLEHVAAVMLDWRWHRLGEDDTIGDPHAFEQAQLEQAGLAHPLISPRYRTGYFQHTFSGGYASGYYSYLWAEAYDADAVAWFEEQLADGASPREAGRRFAEAILSIGGSRDLPAAYRSFRGRERDARFLLERHGLV